MSFSFRYSYDPDSSQNDLPPLRRQSEEVYNGSTNSTRGTSPSDSAWRRFARATGTAHRGVVCVGADPCARSRSAGTDDHRSGAWLSKHRKNLRPDGARFRERRLSMSRAHTDAERLPTRSARANPRSSRTRLMHTVANRSRSSWWDSAWAGSSHAITCKTWHRGAAFAGYSLFLRRIMARNGRRSPSRKA